MRLPLRPRRVVSRPSSSLAAAVLVPALLASLGVALPGVAGAQAAPRAASGPPSGASAELARQRARAARVTITRDRWGIAHVRGRSDADAVFGMIYAQAEDDFARVERNYLVSLGRLAEVEGEREVWRDLRQKLYVDPDTLRAQYAASPAAMRALMDAWADGLNYFLATHPTVRPKLLTRFEPWMALSFTEGSIGGDVESISLAGLARFYGPRTTTVGAPAAAPASAPGDDAARDAAASGDAARADGPPRVPEPAGSNGFAIAPARTANGHALLLINPHTSFYFRPEIHVTSEAGLDAYGAVTWGQFFVYQGFNRRVGWMHTSSSADVIDEFLETVDDSTAARPTYRFGAERRAMRTRTIELPYRLPSGGMARKVVTALYTHRGPVVRAEGSRWVSVRLMWTPIPALQQSWLRTKARSYAEFARVMALRANSSNNTVYADADGTIAYWHGNFVPVRDTQFDYTKPVDGSDPRTDWRGVHDVRATVQLKNPASGWIQNTNNAPWQAAGPSSPRPERYPRYMVEPPENPRGIHAVRVLQARRDFTLDRLIDAAYDPQMPAFEPLIPALVRAWEEAPAGDTLRARLAEPVAMLSAWDTKWGATSIPTTLAVLWGDDLMARSAAGARARGVSVYEQMLSGTTAAEKREALARAVARLERDFGTWRTPWGEVNRFQRLTGDVVQPNDDAKPSLPVPFASALWGSLASIGQRAPRTTRRIYGDYGNSFVAVVEFGPRVRAKSVLAGGVSGDPASPHFTDQASLYAGGRFKDVAFHPDEIARAAVRRYRPGGTVTEVRREGEGGRN